MDKLIISEKIWARGKNSQYLLNENGTMCCLGIYGTHLGIDESKLFERQNPYTHDNINPKWPAWCLRYVKNDGPDVRDLIRTNDDRYISEGERKRIVKELFAKHDVEVKFVP